MKKREEGRKEEKGERGEEREEEEKREEEEAEEQKKSLHVIQHKSSLRIQVFLFFTIPFFSLGHPVHTPTPTQRKRSYGELEADKHER